MSTTVTTPRTPVQAARERFIANTAEHEMAVLRDEGLYRHLRFQKPATSIYYFDLVTWPGYLAIVGDCGDYVFCRTRDMFEFFGPSGARGGFEDAEWGINPDYWSEKLEAPRPEAARKYSFDAFEAHVREWLDDAVEELDDDEAASLRAAVQEQILDDPDGVAYHDEGQAHRLLRDFEHDGHRIHDSWEWDLREYDSRFLWCCWAIVWGLDRYRQARADTPGAGWVTTCLPAIVGPSEAAEILGVHRATIHRWISSGECGTSAFVLPTPKDTPLGHVWARVDVEAVKAARDTLTTGGMGRLAHDPRAGDLPGAIQQLRRDGRHDLADLLEPQQRPTPRRAVTA